jgi:signal transduction histidine kinase
VSTTVTTAPPRAECDAPSRPDEDLQRRTGELARQVTEAGQRLKRAIQEKDRLSRLLNAVLENLEAGVILLGAGGRLMAHNGAARQMGAVVRDPAGAWRLLADLDGVRATAGGASLRPHGLHGPAWEVRVRPVAMPDGSTGQVLLVQDVTELLRLQELSHRQSRLEGLGRMAAELAHEVRNPLGSLELFSSLLVEELDERPDARELAEQILLGVRRLSGTVTHLLARVRGGTLRREAIDVGPLLREVLTAMAPIALARGVELVAPADGEAIAASLDGEGVRQALLNLVGNALDATPAGGTVRLDVRRSGSRIEIDVTDSGPGVPEDLRERIFEPFFSTRGDGTGLGLALVERVAMAHGGSAVVLEGEGGGALFRLSLPDRDA